VIFSDLYGTELDRELGSADRTQLFTTARRKAAINAAQLEWNDRTECYTRQTTVALVDETQEYDLEATITDFHRISKQGVSIRITPATGSVRYVEGDDLEVTTLERLTHEEPGWRSAPASTPTHVYPQRNGGVISLGFHPAPNITVGDTWVALVPYVAIAPDLSADADEPFTVSASANPIKSLRPYHRALVHFGAADLEKYRKDTERGAVQLQLFESYVERYKADMKPKGGQRVRFVHNYRGARAPRIWNPRT
jgi:hypothetical protein